MSEPENFLSRWSRRKRIADERPEKQAPKLDAAPTSEAAPEQPSPEGEPDAKPAAAPVEPVFDPASLPSLDSIGAQTDIAAFLKPGVPSELRLAALRRVWSADPSIRDFKGLAENDWDFNDPNAMPGFGALDPGTDIKKMLADLFGETPRADVELANPSVPAEQLPPSSDELNTSANSAAAETVAEPANDSEIDTTAHNETPQSDNLLQREKNTATRNENFESDDEQINRRRPHGGALPH
jgi:hypothetical protein